MQLNFINNLNALIEASLGTGRSLVEINSRVMQQLLENNLELLQSTMAAGGEIPGGPQPGFSPYGIGAKLATEFLGSGQAAGQILVNSRERYESWAVESAARLGKATQTLTSTFPTSD